MRYDNKKILGITGGVGSGKSTVLDLLEREFQAEILQADLIARELMEPGRSSYEAVVMEFGDGILQEDGTIDRPKLASIIFSNKEKLLKLNSLTHPLVKEEVQRRMDVSAAALVVYESAIPVEACMRELCDEIWFVRVPVETRILRLMASRGYTREKCEAIMASQPSDAYFADLSDRVIENGGTTEETEEQIREILTP